MKQKLINRLVPLLKTSILSPSIPDNDNIGMAFSFKDMGSFTLSHEEAKAFREATQILSEAFPKVGFKTCANELERFCCRFIPQLQQGTVDIPIGQEIPSLFTLLESLQKHRTVVYVQVCGFELRLPQWGFGSAVFMHGNHDEIEKARLSIKDAGGKNPNPLSPDAIVVRMELNGYSDYALKHARNRVEEILDVLQFLTISKNRGAFEDTVIGFSFYASEPIPVLQTPVWYYCPDTSTWGAATGTGTPPILQAGPIKCILDDRIKDWFRPFAGDQLSEMLQGDCPFAFDQGLMTAISWIANGIRERNNARKYLGFFIALEALFSPDEFGSWNPNRFSKTIVPLDEGVAFLLGEDYEHRIKIINIMRELKKKRNLIAHRGSTNIDKKALVQLATYVWNCCKIAALRRNNFEKEHSFRDFMLNLKYGSPMSIQKEQPSGRSNSSICTEGAALV